MAAKKTAKRGSAAKRAASQSRLPRSILEKMMTNLCGRLDEQAQIAQAVALAAAPCGSTVFGEWPRLKVLQLAADVHFRGLQEAARFAKLIHERV